MPFNKGDFTQQGVAGHVNANLRLNEKRLVSIDLTSNEEAEGCTITGTVKDMLNNKVYGIGAGVSGNIEITENTAEGETLNIAPYATATVNVSGGGGNVKTLELTVNATGTTPTAPLKGPIIDENGLYSEGFGVNTSSPVTVKTLISYNRLAQEYGVYLESPNIVFFTDNNTGENCEIIFDGEYPKSLYIVITDITQPASAVINVTTGGVG